MLVIAFVESVPLHLRGFLDRYLNEVRTSIFIGDINPAVIEELWQVVHAEAGEGDAIMITPGKGEAGYTVRYRQNETWKMVDRHGWQLPARRSSAANTPELRHHS